MSSAQKRTILVADDNHDQCAVLGRLLEDIGHKVHIAYDGLEAVALAKKYRPDVVLMDLDMPRLSGYDAARAIRYHLGAGIHLVALSGWDESQHRERCRAAGFDAYLAKPCDFEIIRAAVLTTHPDDRTDDRTE